MAVPSARSPQVQPPPEEIWVKLPPGAVDCPDESSPQQVAVPSARSPQVCQLPAEIWAKAPSGGADWP